MKSKNLLVLGLSILTVVAFTLLPVAPASAANGNGMTWTKVSSYNSGAVRVGCSGCDAYAGDTACTNSLPVLCIYQSSVPDPDPSVSSYYNGWSGGHVGLTTPVQGNQLYSLTNANSLCVGQFGSGWRMAEFHDGNGGWNFRAFGFPADNVRFWTYIDDQPANCWD